MLSSCIIRADVFMYLNTTGCVFGPAYSYSSYICGPSKISKTLSRCKYAGPELLSSVSCSNVRLSLEVFWLSYVQYFTLLSHLLEVYPEKVAQLNSQGFEHLIGTLDFGVRHEVCCFSQTIFAIINSRKLLISS